MPRHKQPEIVAQYRSWTDAGPPKCCHTCYHYSDDGVCHVHYSEPPEDFAAAHDLCNDWEQEIPF